MEISARHQEVEARFRELVADAALPEPDRVGYEPESVVFYWDEPKAAVIVDFDRPPGSPATSAQSRTTLQ